MINPVLSNFEILFSEDFFPVEVTKKYDNFLFHKNYPFKTLRGYLYETIQNVEIPGTVLQTVTATAMGNLGNNPFNPSQNRGNTVPPQSTNRVVAGTAPDKELFTATDIKISFRNTILNWAYIKEIMYAYYKRTRSVKDFKITILFYDSAEIPMIRFVLSDCFISDHQGLVFSFNESFSESKNFDIGFTFNQFDVELVIPDFNIQTMNL